jgi:hypothetical protein
MLSEMGAALIEAIAMVRLIKYLKNIEQIEDRRWPKIVFNDIVQKKEDVDETKYYSKLLQICSNPTYSELEQWHNGINICFSGGHLQ